MKQIHTFKGLSSFEAQARLRTHGLNQISQTNPPSLFQKIINLLKEPTFSLLLVVASIYAVIGELKDTIILLFAIIPIGAMQIIQDVRVDKTLETLRNLMRYQVKVFRDGKMVEIESTLLVPGDIVYISAGDKIPADGIVLREDNCYIDESILTGEAEPQQKDLFKGDLNSLKGQNVLDKSDSGIVFGGTLVLKGEVFMEIVKTGKETEYGKIGTIVTSIQKGQNRLQKDIKALVKKLFIFSFCLALLVFMVVSITSQSVIDGILSALTITIASIPEELPIIYSVFLIMGARRMASHKALVRNMSAIESLGAADVICVDKTGTLTQGSLSVSDIYYDSTWYRGDDKGLLTKKTVDFFFANSVLSGERFSVDPIESSIKTFVRKKGYDLEKFYEEYILKSDFSFDQITKTISHLYIHKKQPILFVAGAPESIIDRCHLSVSEVKQLEQAYQMMSKKGQRVIGFAHRMIASSEDLQDKNGLEKNLVFSGFISMSDPIKKGVKESIASAYQAGIRIMMITGDNPLTALNIADQLGIKHNQKVITGNDIETLSEQQLSQRITDTNIFARILPEQKYKIVLALKSLDKVVAMTGDGVNDAPAIKAADVGIAMGKRGTEVSRESADIILLDDNFATIVKAIENGRRIYQNLKKSFGYLIIIHIVIFGLALFVPLLSYPLLLLPIHIISLELILDPLAVLGFESEPKNKGIMNISPRTHNQSFLTLKEMTMFVIYGLCILLTSICLYIISVSLTSSIDFSRTVTFAYIVLSQFFIIIFTREGSLKDQVTLTTNPVMTIIFIITLVLLLMVIYLPSLAALFKFTLIPFMSLTLVLIGALVSSFLITALTKILISQRKHGPIKLL